MKYKLSDGRLLGQAAFNSGKTHVPALDPAVMQVIKETSGRGLHKQIVQFLTDWLCGWDSENLRI